VFKDVRQLTVPEDFIVKIPTEFVANKFALDIVFVAPVVIFSVNVCGGPSALP
jgi:hypothetical protein